MLSNILAGDAKKVVGEKVDQIGKSGAFQAATSSAATLKKEIEGQRLGGRVYVAPVKLRKRKQIMGATGDGSEGTYLIKLISKVLERIINKHL